MTYCELLCLYFQLSYPNPNYFSKKPTTAIDNRPKMMNHQLHWWQRERTISPSEFWVYFAAHAWLSMDTHPFFGDQTLVLSLEGGFTKQRPNSATTPLWFLGYADAEEKGGLRVHEPLPDPHLPFPLKHTHIFCPPHYIKSCIGPNRHFSQPMNSPQKCV